jgi:hypothetical protein
MAHLQKCFSALGVSFAKMIFVLEADASNALFAKIVFFCTLSKWFFCTVAKTDFLPQREKENEETIFLAQLLSGLAQRAGGDSPRPAGDTSRAARDRASPAG